MDILPVEMLWRGAIAVLPIAILVALICKFAPCKASTRHMLWLIVLLLFAAVPVLPRVSVPQFSAVTDSLKEYFSAPDELHEISRSDLPIIQQKHDVAASINAQESEKVKLPTNEIFLSASSKKIEPSATDLVNYCEAREKIDKDEKRSETKDYSPVQVFVSKKMPDQSLTPDDPQLGAPSHLAIAPTSLKPKSSGVGWSTSGISKETAITNIDPKVLEQKVAATAPIVAEPVKQTAFDIAGEQWNRWSVYISDVRNSIMGLPPLPTFLWIGGAAILLLTSIVKVTRFNRLIRNSRLAPPSVVNMVVSAAEQLKLKRAPLTLITDQSISPMLWCGRKVYLILPRELWNQLDDVGRKAVICHELAHLRRRDHWVCWFEMIIGWLYWWNPVVWWVRKMIREEADLCCDAWVTVIMPTSRRAYAQALLDTRKCTSITQVAGPCVGLGVSTKRAKRFARRLTMVMTEHAAPRLSVRGLTLALALAVGGCIVTPLWACPPSEKAAKQKKVHVELALKEHLERAASRPHAPKSDRHDAHDDEHGTTFEKFMQSRGAGSAKQRIKELRHHIQLLKKELSKIHKSPRVRILAVPHIEPINPLHPELHAPKHDAPHAQIDSGPNHRFKELELRLPKAPKPTRPPKTPRPPKAPGIAVAPRIQIIDGQFPASVIAQGGPGRIAFAPPQSDCNKVFARKYELSGGKLEALTELMVRQDVPIIVSPHNDYIEVHANQAQHMIFSAFTKMIGSDKERKEEYELSSGKLEALTKLMSRSDVPIIIEPDDDEIIVHGTALEQAVFDAFVKMISQSKKTTAVSTDSPFAVAFAPDGEWAVLADELRNAAGKIRYAQEGEWAVIAEKIQEKASKAFRQNSGNWEAASMRYQEAAEKAYSGQMKKWAEAAKIYELKAGKVYQGDLKKIMGSLEGQIQLSTEHATRMAMEAMKIAEMAEMLEVEIESIVEEALQEIEEEDSKGKTNQRKSIERMIKKLMKQIKALKMEAQAIEAEAEVIEGEADLLREQADQVQEAISQVKEIEEIVASNGR